MSKGPVFIAFLFPNEEQSQEFYKHCPEGVIVFADDMGKRDLTDKEMWGRLGQNVQYAFWRACRDNVFTKKGSCI